MEPNRVDRRSPPATHHSRGGGRRHLHRELRHRVANLHRCRDLYDARVDHDTILADLDVEAVILGQQDLTLDAAVHDEIAKMRLAAKWKARLLGLALPHARWATAADPSATACARYAVERAWSVLHVAGALSGGPPSTWVSGHPLDVYGREDPTADRSFGSTDLASLVRPQPILTTVPGDHVIDAHWNPSEPGFLFHGDPIRPPIEAVKLVADIALEEFGQQHRGTAVTVEMGHSAGAQALSAFLPRWIVHSTGTDAIYGPWATVKAKDPSLVVVNIPSDITRVAATVMSQGEADLEQTLRGLDQPRRVDGIINQLPRVEDLALSHVQQDSVLAVMGDAATHKHHHGLQYLGDHLDLDAVPMGVLGIDFDKRAILVRHTKTPWAPYLVPPATDRVVSVWRVR